SAGWLLRKCRAGESQRTCHNNEEEEISPGQPSERWHVCCPGARGLDMDMYMDMGALRREGRSITCVFHGFASWLLSLSRLDTIFAGAGHRRLGGSGMSGLDCRQ